MWTLSGFADEISPDLDEQCRVLTDLGIRHIEFRSAWDTNVLDLDDDQLEKVRATLQRAGIGTSSVGSPIGKISVLYESLRPHLEYLQVKDALLADGTVVPAGEGDGEVEATVRALAGDGYDGFCSMEPPLATAGSLGGFSGEHHFRRATVAFTAILDKVGVEYR